MQNERQHQIQTESDIGSMAPVAPKKQTQYRQETQERVSAGHEQAGFGQLGQRMPKELTDEEMALASQIMNEVGETLKEHPLFKDLPIGVADRKLTQQALKNLLVGSTIEERWGDLTEEQQLRLANVLGLGIQPKKRPPTLTMMGA